MSLIEDKKFSVADFIAFKKTVWDFYAANQRSFEWRKNWTAYKIVVSEIMLQQTQTSRVEKKFAEFIKKFPTFKALAEAEQGEVLLIWVGLGYNRRCVALHEIAKRVISEFAGDLPDDPIVLQTFKGLGPATASSIVTFAFNKPTVFIETNIRAVFLHEFFADQVNIDDKLLYPLIESTLDKNKPREWYYALMDYGVHLKKLHKNPSRKSKHHSVQSRFEGSDRQIRGAIVRHLTQMPLTEEQLIGELPYEPTRLRHQCKKLLDESIIFNRGSLLSL